MIARLKQAISHSGYYRWINSAGVREGTEKKDREDFEQILKAYNQHRTVKEHKAYICA